MSTKLKNSITVCMTVVFLFGFAAWSILKQDDTVSISERRSLAVFPKINSESVLTGEFMTGFEEYTMDHFPLRDRFRTLKAITVFYVLGQKDNNDTYIEDGYASKLEYLMNKESLNHAASRFQFLYDQYMSDKDMNVYFSIVPDKNYFMSGINGYPSLDYNLFISEMQKKMRYAAYIDITKLLKLTDYYHTDIHWRQETILDVARFLASEMGVSLSGEYTQYKVDNPFYGIYYGQSALPLLADDIFYLNNEALERCRVYDFETDSYITVYDMEKAAGNDPYELFLSGSKSLLTIENPEASSEKELIMFRDSFGSSLAPLLVEGYKKITLVDIRYISPNLLDKFIQFNHQDVLFLYSTSVLNNSITLK